MGRHRSRLPYGLSEREMELWTLFAKTGAATKQLAKTLTIEERTAQTHLRNIMQKTGATNRTHLAILWWQKRQDPICYRGCE